MVLLLVTALSRYYFLYVEFSDFYVNLSLDKLYTIS
jgi:hypothetical protein